MSNSKHLYKKLTYPLLLLAAILATGCKQLIDAPTPNSTLIASSVFLDSIPTQSVVNGMYRQFYQSSNASYYDVYIQTDPARLADETYAVTNSLDDFTTNSLITSEANVSQLWANSYNTIYNANNIIEGAAASTTLSDNLKQQISGEALFMRSLCYFYLVNYFGDVPLVLTTDVTVSGSLPRASASTVYAQMVTDLITARNTLASTYIWSTPDRTRATTWAASALLARVYLYQGNWAAAETEATRVINQTSLFSIVPDPNNVFLKNSAESILSFYVNFAGYPEQNAVNLISLINGGVSAPTYAIRNELLNAFESGDTRATKWITSVTYNGVIYKLPYKYKTITNVNTEFQICLRLSEQYLIRAEARLQQNNLTGCQSDLNVIRNRAGLANTTATTAATLPTAIAHERQVEMFMEWGDRWLNLKRTGTSNAILGAEKPNWKPTDALYPVPQAAILTNPNLTQNPGY